MTIKSLREFGTIRRSHVGRGLISLSNRSKLACRFTLAQRSDGQLLFSAAVNLPTWDFAAGNIRVESLTGVLADGRPVTVPGSIVLKTVRPISDTAKTRLIGYLDEWFIGNREFWEDADVSFCLVNFRFLGTESELRLRNNGLCSTLSVMSLNLGKRRMRLKQVEDYEEVEASLRARGNVEVTCVATTTINSGEELDEAVSAIETLSDVMSVARATLVSWISLEVTNLAGRPVFSQSRSSVTRRFAGIELIHRSDPGQTKEFLEKAFVRCRELHQDFPMRRIARAYTETRDGPFVESRSLLIAVLAEYLAGVRARVNARHGLNRRPLSWRLNQLAKSLDLNFGPGEVERFVAARNKLAHEGAFPSDATAIEHYQRMQHFLDRIMLRLFDYHGPYYDFEHDGLQQI
jgi:hypothetical protein